MATYNITTGLGSASYTVSTGARGPVGTGGGASVTISTTPPASPSEGDLWYDSETGVTSTYDGTVWVAESNPPVSATIATFLGAADAAEAQAAIDAMPNTNAAVAAAVALDPATVRDAVGHSVSPFVSKTIVDEADVVYADIDDVSVKTWYVSSGSGTTECDGVHHTLTTSVAGTLTKFKRLCSGNMRFGAIVIDFVKADDNLYSLRVNLTAGPAATSKSIAYVLEWGGKITAMPVGRMARLVVTLADLTSAETCTAEDLRNITSIELEVTPKAATNTAFEIHQIQMVQGDGIGRVCFLFDDNRLDTHTVAAPILAANGFAADIFVEYASVGATTPGAERGTLAQLQARYAEGWGLGGHHAFTWPAYTAANQIVQHVACVEYFRKNGFFRGSDILAWPGGDAGSSVDFIVQGIAQRFWRVMRRVGSYAQYAFPGFYDRFNPPNYYLTSSTQVSALKGQADRAKLFGATIVWPFHGIKSSPTGVDYDTALFTELVEYCASIGMQDIRYSDVCREYPDPPVTISV